MSSRRNYALEAQGVDGDTLYSRCPLCDVISPAASLEYAIGTGGDLDPARPGQTGCIPGQHKYVIALEQILQRDTEVAGIAGPGANRPAACGRRFLVPATADHGCCPKCRVYQAGAAALRDPQWALLVRDGEAQFGGYARAAVTEARRTTGHPAGEGR